MISIDRIEHGFKKYVDNHFIPDLPDGGLERIIVATGAGILANRVKPLLHEWSKKSMFHALGLVNEHGFDLEGIKTEMMKHVGDQGFHLEIPIAGTVTFKREDIEKLYRCIVEM